MRQLAGVVGSLGLILAAYLALTPVAVDVPHGDGRCGPSAVRLVAQEHDDDPNAQAIIVRCEDAARERLVPAAVALGVGALGFLALRVAARRHDAVERRRRAARRPPAPDPPNLGPHPPHAAGSRPTLGRGVAGQASS
ncbi:MAG TPA: hypothetical protein VFU19_21200 [Iamia sp.]|nr:hypothetical protein [Iamia sp.]